MFVYYVVFFLFTLKYFRGQCALEERTRRPTRERRRVSSCNNISRSLIFLAPSGVRAARSSLEGRTQRAARKRRRVWSCRAGEVKEKGTTDDPRAPTYQLHSNDAHGGRPACAACALLEARMENRSSEKQSLYQAYRSRLLHERSPCMDGARMADLCRSM